MILSNRINKRIGCFIIPGSADNSTGIIALVEYLEYCGYYTYCFGMEGNKKIRDARHATYTDWIKHSEKSFEQFLDVCDMVVLIGFSIGGLVAIHLASKYKTDALITISTPSCSSITSCFTYNKLNTYERQGKGLIHRYMEGITRYSIRASFHFKRFVHVIMERVKTLNCPLLVIQGKKDNAVKCGSAYYIYEKAAANQKEIQIFPKSGHTIFEDCENKLVFIRIHQFIERVIGSKISLHVQAK